MSYLEIFLLSVSLCFDTFAVSVSSGICLPQIPRLKFARIVLVFTFFQAFLTFVGWLAGMGFLNYISSVDHWIAFFLLLYIGSKMVLESLSKKNDNVCTDLRKTNILLAAAFATSIDAVAAGISLAIIQLSALRITITVVMIGTATAIAAITGIKGGRRIGNRIGKRAELAGGIILIILGFKILMEHLNILY